MKVKITSTSFEQTMQIAEKIGQGIKFPCVISLKGDLGAGKTTFTKGLAKGLNITEDITSPTFTIMNEYNSSPFNLYHFDMYRLADMEEAINLGFEEYFDLKLLKGVVVVEWAENVEGLLPIKITEIELVKTGEESRDIIIEYKGMV